MDWTKTGGETQIYDLLGEKQRSGIRLYNRSTQFIARQRAKREGTLEAYDDPIRARGRAQKTPAGSQRNEEPERGREAACGRHQPESHLMITQNRSEQVEDWQAERFRSRIR